MKKKVKKVSTLGNLRALLIGLGVIYVGSFLLVGVKLLAQGYIDIYYGNAWSKNVYVQDVKELDLKTVQGVIGFTADFGLVSGIIAMLIIVLFAFSGWLILKLAKTKLWYLPALPVLFIALFSFTLTSSGNYLIFSMPFTQMFGDTIKPFFILICLIAALLGGWIQCHVSVHK